MMRFSLYRKTGFPFWAALAAMLLETSVAPVPAPAAKPAAAPAAVQAAPVPAQVRAVAATVPAAARPRQLSLSDIRVRKELPITQWLRPGEYLWDDSGAAPGPVTIVVNIRARVLSAYRDGVEIGRSSVIYGSNDKPTPFGTFPILQKDADHRSTIYDGAPMPHMLRLTGDGVAIHGSEIADDYATHGCIGLPKAFARLLFRAAHVGDPVLIWKGDRLPEAPSA
jgi:lipoprotein-anchoring transpeptidase ErfK/SrfK